MNKIIYNLEDIDSSIFYGEYDANFKLIQDFFPKLKINGRGATITASGTESELEILIDKLDKIIKYINKYNRFNKTIAQGILNEDNSKKIFEQNCNVIINNINGKAIIAKTKNLKKLVELSSKKDMVFAIGPAGTGKTYTSVAIAVKALKNNEIKRIILTRPAVEAGESLGFLPGDLKEKLDPYLQPLYDALRDMIKIEKLGSYIDKNIIEIAPLAFMRGRTLDDAFVILDEAQNTTPLQMKMFLTRMGQNAKFIITGDPWQVDLPKHQKSGLIEAIRILKKLEGIGIVELSEEDVVRHRLVRDIISAYNKDENS